MLDLGTGTGAIALALAHDMPSLKMEAVDLVSEAVSLAKENQQALALKNVSIYQSEWFGSVTGCFDVIVSNPPYIEEADKHLQQGDVRFEPISALTSGKDGLRDITLIAQQALKYLHDGAWLLIEHGWNQGGEVRKIFAACGYENIETVADYGGRDRVTLAQFFE